MVEELPAGRDDPWMQRNGIDGWTDGGELKWSADNRALWVVESKRRKNTRSARPVLDANISAQCRQLRWAATLEVLTQH